jgi:adenylate cyclase
MAPRVERKLAAIVAIDVVGYSRLVGADEMGALARVKAYRTEFVEPLITEHHGRVVKLTGDGALVEFGSAVDAVECAIAIQQGMAKREAAESDERRIRYRIGINIGDIVHEDGDIFGDGVNVAARLEGLAKPGSICVARNVYDQVKNKVTLTFSPLGTHRVKNIAEPVTAYQVTREPEAAARAGGSTGHPRVWAAVVLAAVSAAGGLMLWQGSHLGGSDGGGSAIDTTERRSVTQPTDKPTIAVLPFDNFSSPADSHFADGLAEDLITDLSKLRGLNVIARTSSYALRGQSLAAHEIGKRLGARYLVEGSFRKEADRIRVNAQLIDTETGQHRWAERWDRPADDILKVQDELTGKIVAMLDV